jgi:predicted ATPase
VAAICRKLDGLPLAIKLLSTRLKMMTPQTQYTHLSNQLGLHTQGIHSLPAHQTTLYEIIDRNYQLLNTKEQRLFTHLSIFEANFSLEAVEQKLGSSYHDLTYLIDSLLEKSLLQRSTSHQREASFYMLSTIHRFASEQRLGFNPPGSNIFLNNYSSNLCDYQETIQPDWLDHIQWE